MCYKKAISFLLSVVMLMTMLPFHTVFAGEDKENRSVYVHAAGENPTETADVSTVYRDETANVYLAVDNPNKGETANGIHKEPQYDMNGYTVTFYFDPNYFDYVGNSAEPIDYTVPNDKLGDVDSGKENELGYYTVNHGSGTANIGGKEYKTAYATILFSGFYLPDKQPDDLWYNLCKLPLKPLKTGSSEVFIAVDSVGNDDAGKQYDLELLAKNASTGEYPPAFTYDVRNGGHHTIKIIDRQKPSAPVATPIAGSYSEPQDVTLSVNETGCEIWYSVNGADYIKFDPKNPIHIDMTSTITCYAKRISDGKQSNTVSYTYTILPGAPFLFDSEKNLIPNVYSNDKPFRVYAADKNVFQNIADDSEVYYTFSQSLDANNPVITEGADNPETQWVKVTKGTDKQYIDIVKTCIVRLITKKGGEFSEAAWYNFGIKPAPVTAVPGSGEYDKKIDVALSTETTGAEIYYTNDGSDPRENGGILYTGTPLTIFKDTTLRATAKYNGVYSDVTSYYYIFNIVDDYGVDAFYPSGVYEGSVDVTLTPQNPDYTVYYSTDGGKTFKEYNKGEILSFDKDTDLIAYTKDKNGNRGENYTFTYQIKPLPPIFAPETTQFTNASTVTVYRTQTDDNSKLYYTIDGSNPITNGILANGDSVVLDITKYTVISAVTEREGRYSSVVTHSYDIVTTKPVKPLVTLTPGIYTRTPGSEPYTTQFLPVPNGTTIYYTVDGSDPIPGKSGTIEYKAGDKIDVYGKTMIKAVAVNVFNVKSDIGIFDYTIVPAAPVAPPSADVSEKLPVIPVTAVEGSTVSYEINGTTNSFKLESGTVFYLDTATGNAYQNKDCTILLGTKSGKTLTAPAVLTIGAELDGVESEKNQYRYGVTDNPNTVAAPYADKVSGTYEQIAIDANNNLLEINLYDLDKDAQIEYMTNNNGVWQSYSGSIKLKEDTVLQVRAIKENAKSTTVSYVYTFVPLAPVIELVSGTYSETQYTSIALDSRAPSDREYTIMYRRNGDKLDVPYKGAEIFIDHTMSLKAYVLEENSGKTSKNAINYYIIDSSAESGSVYVGYPYDQGSRYSTDEIIVSPYSEGIKLLTANPNAAIHYYYTYKTEDGKSVTSNTAVYDNSPIITSPYMTEIKITAWLVDENGSDIAESKKTFPFEFVKLSVPKTSLAETGKIEFASGTKYTLINDYPGDENIIIYYTLDGSDPADETNENRKIYNGEELTISGATTVKTVYFSACGKCVNCKDEKPAECLDSVYGKVGTYQYTVPKQTGGGGGGGGGGGYRPSDGGNNNIDNTRKYTKDIFGNEHPTHIGYISGYPDGSVKADGQITREEIAAVLYRVRNKTYDEPVQTTGEVFPDVKNGRWSLADIEYLAHYNIINGYPDGEYKPERNLTRAEFATLIRRFAELDDVETENIFPDVDETLWAYDDIIAIYKAGLIDGYEDGTFRPESEITRAEVMTIINKLLGRNPSEPYVKTLKFNPYTDLEQDKWYYVTVLEATITHNYYLDKDGVEEKWEDYK